MKKIYFLLLAVIAMIIYLSTGKLYAQDVHFSHIHASPTYLNPALNGLFAGDFRLIANYKQQWKSVTANYRTVAAGFDTKLLDLDGHGFLSLGANFYSDKAGDLDFSTNQFNVAVAMAKSLNPYNSHYLTVGFQAGFIHNSLDFSKMYVFDQEPAIGDNVPDNVLAPDFSAGLAWSLAIQQDYQVYAGLSLFHINRPNMAMIGQAFNYEEQLQMKWVFHGGGEVKLGQRFVLMPSFLFMEQSPHREMTLGSFIKHKFDPGASTSGTALYFGSWVRWFYRTDVSTRSDALIMSMRLDNNSISYTFSYDLNMSSLTKASKGQGGPELSVIYIGDLTNSSGKFKSKMPRSKIECPTF